MVFYRLHKNPIKRHLAMHRESTKGAPNVGKERKPPIRSSAQSRI